MAMVPFLLVLFPSLVLSASQHIIHIPLTRLPFFILSHKLGVEEYVLHNVCYALLALVCLLRWDYLRRKEQQLGVPMMRQYVYPQPTGNKAQSITFPALPYLGHALTFWLHTPWDVLMDWHKSATTTSNDGGTWHPAVAFPLLGRYMFSIASPSLLKAVLQTHIRHTAKDLHHSLQPFLSILGTGLVSSHGKHWMDQRKKMSHPIRVQVLEQIPRHTVVAVERCMDTIQQNHTGRDRTTPLPLGHALRQLTLQVISSAFLSLSAQESDETFALYYLPIVEESNRRVWHPYRKYCCFLPAFWQYLWNVYQLNTYVSQLIRTRWSERQQQQANKKENADVLDQMLDCLPQQSQSSLSWAQVRQCRDEIKTFVLAGHETSAAAMTWTLYELMQNPQLMAQVRKEASAVLGSTAQSIRRLQTLQPDDVSQLVLAEACLKESLRKYSVVPMSTRVVTRAFTVDGVQFPKGSMIALNIQSVHLNPAYWPEPMRYDPQRFLQPQQPPEPFTFLPFIAGPRNCLGQNLALLESKLVIALLVQRYDLSLASNDDDMDTESWEGDQNPRHRFMIPVIPKDELMVHAKKR